MIRVNASKKNSKCTEEKYTVQTQLKLSDSRSLWQLLPGYALTQGGSQQESARAPIFYCSEPVATQLWSGQLTIWLVLPFKCQKIFGVRSFGHGSVGLHETTIFLSRSMYPQLLNCPTDFDALFTVRGTYEYMKLATSSLMFEVLWPGLLRWLATGVSLFILMADMGTKPGVTKPKRSRSFDTLKSTKPKWSRSFWWIKITKQKLLKILLKLCRSLIKFSTVCIKPQFMVSFDVQGICLDPGKSLEWDLPLKLHVTSNKV